MTWRQEATFLFLAYATLSYYLKTRRRFPISRNPVLFLGFWIPCFKHWNVLSQDLEIRLFWPCFTETYLNSESQTSNMGHKYKGRNRFVTRFSYRRLLAFFPPGFPMFVCRKPVQGKHGCAFLIPSLALTLFVVILKEYCFAFLVYNRIHKGWVWSHWSECFSNICQHSMVVIKCL